jgi:hypothetical protein
MDVCGFDTYTMTVIDAMYGPTAREPGILQKYLYKHLCTVHHSSPDQIVLLHNTRTTNTALVEWNYKSNYALWVYWTQAQMALLGATLATGVRSRNREWGILLHQPRKLQTNLVVGTPYKSAGPPSQAASQEAVPETVNTLAEAVAVGWEIFACMGGWRHRSLQARSPRYLSHTPTRGPTFDRLEGREWRASLTSASHRRATSERNLSKNGPTYRQA